MSEPEIKSRMVESGAMAKIKTGSFSRKQKDQVAAKSQPGGNSVIVNLYNETGNYIATAHQVIDIAGQTTHCDVKRFIYGAHDYRIPRTLKHPANP